MHKTTPQTSMHHPATALTSSPTKYPHATPTNWQRSTPAPADASTSKPRRLLLPTNKFQRHASTSPTITTERTDATCTPEKNISVANMATTSIPPVRINPMRHAVPAAGATGENHGYASATTSFYTMFS
eukprot:scaffold60691_cov78-Cyclotella_meneghiniana.AAC.4